MGYKKQSSKKCNEFCMFYNRMTFYSRGRNNQQRKPPYKAGIAEMNDQVNNMIIPDIKLVEMVIKRKCKITDWPGGNIIPPGVNI